MSDYIKRVEEYEIDSSHRSAGPEPCDSQPPWVILVKFLHYMTQWKVLAITITERGMQWEYCTLSTYKYMTTELSEPEGRLSSTMEALALSSHVNMRESGTLF